MNVNYAHLVPENFNDNAKVWVYQATRMLGIAEALQADDILQNFVSNWQSHGNAVKGFANIFFGRFIVLMADETQATVSGCSTDASVRVIKQLEETFNISLFNRQQLAFIVKDKIELLPLSQLDYAINNGFIQAHTLYFNNLVNTKADFLNNWIIPANKSWLGKKFALNAL
jgi:hypothetical protein